MRPKNESLDLKSLAANLQAGLGLKSQPIAITFQNDAPQNDAAPEIPKNSNAAPSSCTYWRLAAEGGSFWTESGDHLGCPIGAHTHGVELPSEKARELEGLIETMIGLEYLRPDEVASIPTRQEKFKVAVYSPLADAAAAPDVVIMKVNAHQMMLLSEACGAAGIKQAPSLMGRPTCAALPVAIQSGQAAVSVGCIGNRVYTELQPDEFYMAIPGVSLAALAEKLPIIIRANRELELFHIGRRNGDQSRSV
jgi:uncharacterized protein (DUF169 family)